MSDLPIETHRQISRVSNLPKEKREISSESISDPSSGDYAPFLKNLH